MTANEIKEKIQALENWMEWEQYADFINWAKYYEAKHEVEQLQAELEKIGG